MSLPNPAMNFTAFDILTAAEMNELVENIEALADGSGLDTNAIPAAALATNAIKLGYAQITSNFTTTSTTAVQVTGLSSSVTVPAGGRSIRVTAYTPYLTNSATPKTSRLEIWEGTVGSGTRLNYSEVYVAFAGQGAGTVVIAEYTPSSGAKTYNVGLVSDTGGGTTATVNASATSPAFISVEVF